MSACVDRAKWRAFRNGETGKGGARRKGGGKRHNARGIPRHFRITPAKSPRVFAFPRGERRQKLIAYLRGQQWSAIPAPTLSLSLPLCSSPFPPRRSLRKSKTLLPERPPPAPRPRAPRTQISFRPVYLTSLRPRKDAGIYRVKSESTDNSPPPRSLCLPENGRNARKRD